MRGNYRGAPTTSRQNPGRLRDDYRCNRANRSSGCSGRDGNRLSTAAVCRCRRSRALAGSRAAHRAAPQRPVCMCRGTTGAQCGDWAREATCGPRKRATTRDAPSAGRSSRRQGLSPPGPSRWPWARPPRNSRPPSRRRWFCPRLHRSASPRTRRNGIRPSLPARTPRTGLLRFPAAGHIQAAPVRRPR